MQKNDSVNFRAKTFNNSWNSHFSFRFDYRLSNWISCHIRDTYGSALTYLENVSQKNHLIYGFRAEPFYKTIFGILHCFRVELRAINASFTDVEAKQSFSIPAFPYFYRQWKKNNKKIKCISFNTLIIISKYYEKK